MPLDSRAAAVRSLYELPVVPPYRLDLTVSALRRLPTNLVDVLTPGKEYVRALEGSRGPVIVRVSQSRPDLLAVELEGEPPEHERALALVRRMLGVDRDLVTFARAAGLIPWLNPLALRLRGLKPPRYPTLWEAFVNAIVFQQVSLHAASAVVRRVILALQPSIERGGVRLCAFPDAGKVLSADDRLLREAGLSAGKLATLRRAGEALADGSIDEATLEGRSSPDAAALLRQIKGIGPWTATVILLRGLGRLDVFPMNDSGVARNLALLAGTAPTDVGEMLETLGSERGMLYYHLLLARLEARGEIGLPSMPV